jgi:hypothetical protein
MRAKIPSYWDQGVYAVILNVLMSLDNKLFNMINPTILGQCLEKIYMQSKMAVID